MEIQTKLEHKIELRWLILFALPTIFSNIFGNLYTAVDGIFVARFVDTDALSAINISMPMAYLASALGMMFGTGGNALIAKKIGEGKRQEAREDFSLLMAVNVFASGWFTALNDGKTSAILSFCRTILFMVIPVLVLPQIFEMDGVWLSILAGEMLSLAMSIYYFVRFRYMWQISK